MGSKKTLSIDITADASKATRALKRLEGEIGNTGKSVEGFGHMAKRWLVGAGITTAIFGSLSKADESMRVARQTQAVIKSTGDVAGVTAKQINDLATSISNKTGVDDEAIQTGENMLLTFKNVRNEAGKGNDIFNQATQAMVDLAAATGTDAKGAALQLGKALNDPIKGVTRLQRVGVTFTDQQKEQIKTLVASGKTMDAQKIILRELASEFGGSAAAQTSSLAKVKTQLGNIAETVGTQLMPAVNVAAKGVTVLARILSVIPGPVVTIGTVVVGGAAAWAMFGGAVTGTIATMRAVTVAIGQYTPSAIVARSATQGLAAAMTEQAGAAEASAVATRSAGAASATGAGRFASLGAKASLAAAGMFAVGKVGDVIGDRLTKNLHGAAASTNDLAASWVEATKAGKSINIDQLGNDMLSLQSKTHGATGKVASFLGTIGHIGTLGQMSSDVDNLAHRIDQYDKALVKLVQSGNVETATKLHGQMVKSLESSGVSAAQVKKGFNDYDAAIKENTISTAGASSAQDGLTSSTDRAKAAAKQSADAVKNLTDTLQHWKDGSTDALSASVNWQGALERVRQAVKDDGTALDTTTAKGRDLAQAFIEAKNTAIDQASALIQNGGSAYEAQQKMWQLRQELINTMQQAGFTQAQIGAMIAQMQLTPTDITTNIVATGVVSATQQVQDLNNVLAQLPEQKAVDIRAAMSSGPGGTFWGAPTRARGGKLGKDWTLVGEEGPELVHRDQVISAERTHALLSGGPPSGSAGASPGMTVVVNVSGSVVAERDLALAVREQLISLQRRSSMPLLAGIG